MAEQKTPQTQRAPQTIAASNGVAQDLAFGAVAPPIYLTSTFAFKGFERPGAHEYTRTSNPTRDVLADTLAKLEGGAGAVTLAGGMAAVNLLLAPLEKPGDLVIAPYDCYSGVQRLLSAHAAQGHFGTESLRMNRREDIFDARDWLVARGGSRGCCASP